MEFINQVHLRGIVGTVREVTVDGTAHYRFSLCTEYLYRGNQGAVVETTWHDVSYFAKQGERLEWLTKGAIVEVEGRIRMQSYCTPEGETKSICSVCVSSVKQVTEG